MLLVTFSIGEYLSSFLQRSGVTLLRDRKKSSGAFVPHWKQSGFEWEIWAFLGRFVPVGAGARMF
jgi:hypothetical protein